MREMFDYFNRGYQQADAETVRYLMMLRSNSYFDQEEARKSLGRINYKRS